MTTAPSTTQGTTHPTLTIGGEQQPGGAGSYPVHNPARPAEVVDHAPAADLAQLDAAVQAARWQPRPSRQPNLPSISLPRFRRRA